MQTAHRLRTSIFLRLREKYHIVLQRDFVQPTSFRRKVLRSFERVGYVERFYTASDVHTRIRGRRCASPYINAVRAAASERKESEKKKHTGSDKDLIVMAHRCGGAFTVGRRRPSQPHRANCNSVETIGASGSSAPRRMRDTIVRARLVPGTFSSLTFLWWYNPPPR